jgi:hypothetical protein
VNWVAVGAATALFVAGIHLACWGCWTYRGLPSLLVDPEGFRRVRRTAELRMLLAIASTAAGLAVLGQWLATAVTAAVAALLGVQWASSRRAHPRVHARDRPPGGHG